MMWGPMTHLQMYIHPTVVKHQVTGDADTLSLPVNPHPLECVVYAVILYRHVDGGVQFDPSHFKSAPPGRIHIEVLTRICERHSTLLSLPSGVVFHLLQFIDQLGGIYISV